MTGGAFVLNFYSPVFADQLRRGRKTATVRLGDKTRKYERGQVVCIFPEGGITRSGQLQHFKPGMLQIVRGTSAPVIPVYLMRF